MVREASGELPKKSKAGKLGYPVPAGDCRKGEQGTLGNVTARGVAMRQPKKFAEQNDRFKELVLYISEKCANDQTFDSLKLSKVLFFSDFLAYAHYGQPITGFEYVKMEKGPAPKRIKEMKNQMVEVDRTLGLQTLPLRDWRRPVNLRKPDVSNFKGTEIALVDQIIDALKETDGDAVSEFTHDWLCWKTALGQTIPYEMIFLSHEEPTPADVERGKAVAGELALLERTVVGTLTLPTPKGGGFSGHTD